MRGILWLDAEESVKLGKQTQLIEYFVAGATARTAAALGKSTTVQRLITFIGYEKLLLKRSKWKCPWQGKLKWMKVISVADSR